MTTNTEAPTRELTLMDLAANRGVDLLDEIRPDWRTRVNFDTLDMSDPDSCIIGQITNGCYTYELHQIIADAIAAGLSPEPTGEYDQSETHSYWFAAVHGFDHFAENGNATDLDAYDSWKRAM